MKKNIFLGFGAMVLALGGVLAGRASTKFLAANQIYYKIGTGACTVVASSITGNTRLVTNTSGTVATLQTKGNSATATLYATQTCQPSKVLYFQP